MNTSFDRYAQKLEDNVYGSLKGKIRLHLLVKDIGEFCPSFFERSLSVLDIGGGVGHFTGICLENSHSVLFCEHSKEMIDRAKVELQTYKRNSRLQFLNDDFLDSNCCESEKFDIVLMHGAAEWMQNTERAIEKACECVRKDGYLSLLVYNRDKYLLKKGINGHLLEGKPSKKKKLVPPGARSLQELTAFLESQGGKILLQSGIRVFQGFFREIDQKNLSPEQWLAQEEKLYRTPPFSSLGEHSHLIWQAG